MIVYISKVEADSPYTKLSGVLGLTKQLEGDLVFISYGTLEVGVPRELVQELVQDTMINYDGRPVSVLRVDADGTILIDLENSFAKWVSVAYKRGVVELCRTGRTGSL